MQTSSMPSSSTVYRWLLDESFKAFWEQYEKARNIQAEQLFEEILDIADDGTNDFYERNVGSSTIVAPDSEHIQRSRLRVDTRKWFLSKVLPKKFGDKMDLTTKDKELPTPLLYVLNNDLNKEAVEPDEED